MISRLVGKRPTTPSAVVGNQSLVLLPGAIDMPAFHTTGACRLCVQPDRVTGLKLPSFVDMWSIDESRRGGKEAPNAKPDFSVKQATKWHSSLKGGPDCVGTISAVEGRAQGPPTAVT